MSKQTRAEKRAEEARIIAEMDEAMGKTSPSDGAVNAEEQGGKYAPQPQTLHCKRCKSVMENGVCPVCGFRMYTPMDEKKQKKIRIIAGIVCVAVFLVLFFVLRIGR